jgi:hypothetical protein
MLFVFFLFTVISLSMVSMSFAESDIICSSCVIIPSYEIDLYKKLFPLTVWTDSEIYDHQSIINVNGYLRPQNNIAPILVVVTNPIGNIVSVEQIQTDSNGNFSFNLNTASSLFKQNGNYILKVQSGSDTRQFKTKFTLISTISSNKNDCMSYEISIMSNNGNIYCIPFKVTNGIVTGAEGTLNLDTKTIVFDIRGQDVESIILNIPRSLLDSKSSTGYDSSFIITSKGKMVEYQELEDNSNYRQIKLDHTISREATFELIGTTVMPEFDSASLVILMGSVISIFVLGKSLSIRFVKF